MKIRGVGEPKWGGGFDRYRDPESLKQRKNKKRHEKRKRVEREARKSGWLA